MFAVPPEAQGTPAPIAQGGAPGAPRCTGIVKRWTHEKGFGFIVPSDGGEDVFVHRSSLKHVSDLATGNVVSFTRFDDGKSRGKFQALDVAVVSAGTKGCIFADVAATPEEAAAVDGPVGMDLLLEIAAESSEAAAHLVRDFTMHSSLESPFLVLCEEQVVNNMRPPSAEELDSLLGLVDAFVAGCEERDAVLLVDFEGEQPGHGGEILVAQVQWTSAIIAGDLVPRPVTSAQLFKGPGLFIDLRSKRCVAPMKRIMESRRITKFLWGCKGDCESLMYQVQPTPMDVHPSMIVDAQLGFDDKHLIGLKRMLEHVDQELLEGLPNKEQIDWDAFHAQNRRALPLPLDQLSALYALDDLHRIEAVVCSKLPPSRSYKSARDATARMLSNLRKDPCGLRSLHYEHRRIDKIEGIKKTAKAVQLMRHVRSVRLRGHDLTPEDNALLGHVEDRAGAELSRHGVVIPEDLSFLPWTSMRNGHSSFVPPAAPLSTTPHTGWGVAPFQ